MLQDSWIATVHPPSWPIISLMSVCLFPCVFVCMFVSVCAAGEEQKLISTGRNVFSSESWMEGVRERVSERKSKGCCCRLLLQCLTLGKQLQTGSNRQARHTDRYRPGIMGGDGWGLGW